MAASSSARSKGEARAIFRRLIDGELTCALPSHSPSTLKRWLLRFTPDRGPHIGSPCQTTTTVLSLDLVGLHDFKKRGGSTVIRPCPNIPRSLCHIPYFQSWNPRDFPANLHGSPLSMYNRHRHSNVYIDLCPL